MTYDYTTSYILVKQRLRWANLVVKQRDITAAYCKNSFSRVPSRLYLENIVAEGSRKKAASIGNAGHHDLLINSYGSLCRPLTFAEDIIISPVLFASFWQLEQTRAVDNILK